MKPSVEIIDKFKRLYKEEFEEELSDEAAVEKFSRVVNVLRVIIYGHLDTPEESGNLGPKGDS